MASSTPTAWSFQTNCCELGGWLLLSPDGRTAIVSDNSDVVGVDLAGRRPVNPTAPLSSILPAPLAFSPTTGLLYTQEQARGNTIVAVEVTDYRWSMFGRAATPAWELTGQPRVLRPKAAVSPDGRHLYLCTGTKKNRRIDLKTKASEDVPPWLWHQGQLSPDGARVYFLQQGTPYGVGASLEVYETSDWSHTSHRLPKETNNALALTPDGQWAWTGVAFNAVLLIHLPSMKTHVVSLGAVLGPGDKPLAAPIATPDCEALYVTTQQLGRGSPEGLYRVSTKTLTAQRVGPALGPRGSSFASSLDGSCIFSLAYNGSYNIFGSHPIGPPMPNLAPVHQPPWRRSQTSGALLAPVHLDLLHLSAPTPAVAPRADFSRLPWFSKDGPVNGDTPWLGSEVFSQPFATADQALEPGVHLHWTLPEGLQRAMRLPFVRRQSFLSAFGAEDGAALWALLTKQGWITPAPKLPVLARVCDDLDQREPSELEATWLPDSALILRLLRQPTFPCAPNRWLVSRYGAGGALEEQWVVESDYVWPEGSAPPAGTVSFPRLGATPGEAPHCHLGRSLPFNDWLAAQGEAPADTLSEPLTALGYGDPAFADVYTSCASVFGFHDAEVSDPKGRSWEVLGWHSDPALDYLRTLMADPGTVQERRADPKAALSILSEQLGFALPGVSADALPDLLRTLCFATVKVDAEGLTRSAPDPDAVHLAMGNSGSEAMSTLLASQLSAGQRGLVEDHLESLRFDARFRNRRVDVGAKFKEMRHEEGFVASDGGALWSVRALSGPKGKASAEASAQEAPLSEAVAHQLNALNLAQRAFDRATRQIEDMRQQVYADWCRYMICNYPPSLAWDSYPDPDEVQYYIQTQDFPKLDALTAAQARAAGAVAKAKVALEAALTAAQPKGAPTLTLQRRPAPRFWRPADPVLLLSGEALKPTARHSTQKTVDCALLSEPLSDLGVTRASYTTIHAAIAALNVRTISSTPWHPMMLEWSVEVLPYRTLAGELTQSPYPAGYLGGGGDGGRFALNPSGPGFTLSAGEPPASLPQRYSGSHVLSPVANHQVGAALDRATLAVLNSESGGGTVWTTFRAARGLDSAMTATQGLAQLEAKGFLDWTLAREASALTVPGLPTPNPDTRAAATWLQTSAHLDSFLSAALAAMKAAPSQAATARRLLHIVVLTQARAKLDETHALSQALGGFHDALLMRRQGQQLGVQDPLAFPSYLDFDKQVRRRVRASNTFAPLVHQEFNPLRAGELRLITLRVVDCFGQFIQVDASRAPVTASETVSPLTPKDAAVHALGLLPRFAQPARLSFRFLSARLGELESNDHPATTPICGWFMPNLLDESLMVYDGAGFPLGYVDVGGQWRTFPGLDGPVLIEDLEPHLARVTRWVSARAAAKAGNMKSFLDSLAEGVAAIHPDDARQHQGLALLMGRPLAVVRAQINLELSGLPAASQSWTSFAQDMLRDTRDTMGVEALKVPVRVGEHGQLDDGVVGCWLEGPQGRIEALYTPQSGDAATFGHAHDDPPLTVTLLVDPTGSIHATCGLLPVKQLRVPPHHYSSALQNIQVAFLTAPLLSDRGQLHVSLPEEPGYAWSWVERQGQAWEEQTTEGWLTMAALTRAFPRSAREVWQALVQAGWITPVNSSNAHITPVDGRPGGAKAALGAPFAALTPQVEAVLQAGRINPFHSSATFTGPQALREGWLKLSPSKSPSST